MDQFCYTFITKKYINYTSCSTICSFIYNNCIFGLKIDIMITKTTHKFAIISKKCSENSLICETIVIVEEGDIFDLKRDYRSVINIYSDNITAPIKSAIMIGYLHKYYTKIIKFTKVPFYSIIRQKF